MAYVRWGQSDWYCFSHVDGYFAAWWAGSTETQALCPTAAELRADLEGWLGRYRECGVPDTGLVELRGYIRTYLQDHPEEPGVQPVLGVPGALPIERDIDKRWEAGTPHHPRSQALYRRLAELDRPHNHFGWRSGGDGDNGEILMYGLDVLFEEDDAAGQSA